ncbi:MAG: efflux RND transporter periplasmic adaptor subunit [Bryobacterales bacterium]|nr:efflux RND transporter periplasmic adaptor subunit [Bryobacterales bacterium]
MPVNDPKPPRSGELGVADTNEENLRREIADLKRQLIEQKGLLHAGPDGAGIPKPWHPSGVVIASLFVLLTALVVVAFFAGYIPLRKRQAIIQSEAQQQEQALPVVQVIEVGRSNRNSELQLPGNIQAITEAPILSRADGYIRTRLVDIGDRVRAGQTVAEIEAPEIDQQIRQARAALQQAQAGLDQAIANHEQGQTNMELARVTAQRWASLAAQGVVSRQENDQYQAQFQSQSSNVQALEKAIAAQRGNIAAAEANLARLNEVQSYRTVKAPFDGVVTQRNVDVGALVVAGNTLLYRVAQTDTLRTYLNVPQVSASSIKLGQAASLSVANLPRRRFSGTVARMANALDPGSRTMLVEIQVPNPGAVLMPGMYAQIDLTSFRSDAPLLIPSTALIARAEGPQVAVVRPDHTVHIQKVEIGRDYGDRLEVSGLQYGDLIIANPSDTAREGAKVDPVALDEEAPKK